jgi:hypothetical protein
MRGQFGAKNTDVSDTPLCQLIAVMFPTIGPQNEQASAGILEYARWHM